MPTDLEITDNGDKAALKLVKFVQATSKLSLPKEPDEYETNRQITFNILNNTAAGTGAVLVEKFVQEKAMLTSTSPANVNEEQEKDDKVQHKLHQFCCSGPEYCIVNSLPNADTHTCPRCNKAVHAVCGVVNPDFELNKVGLKFSTICMKCSKIDSGTTLSPTMELMTSEKGMAFKRPDGQWWVCISNTEPYITTQEDLLNTEMYLITPYGLQLSAEERKEQSCKRKRQRRREEVKSQKAAKLIAEKKGTSG